MTDVDDGGVEITKAASWEERGRRKEEGREGEFFTTPPIDSGKESSSTTMEMVRAGEGTMREMEGGGGNARQAGAETEGRMPERTAEKWKLGLGSETTTKSPSNNQQRAGSPLAFLELLKQRRRGQGRQKEEIDGLKGMRE